MGKHDEYIEIAYELRHETYLAVLISDGDKEGWVPKSYVEDGFNFNYEENGILPMATWFAEIEEWI